MRNAETKSELSSRSQQDLFDYLLRLGDDRLVLGHRLSQWCGHGPILEEDLALTNISLDLIGQAKFLLELAGEVEGKNRSADDLAYLREAIDFRCLKLVEQPIGDYAYTIARQFLFDVYDYYQMEQLCDSKFEKLSAIAAKAVKEARYHLRHSRQWVLRLGDGTQESHRRIQTAFDEVWMYTGEMFEADDLEDRLLEEGLAADLRTIRTSWAALVHQTLVEATLTAPSDEQYMQSGSRKGFHSEYLGHVLSELQILPRSYPGAKW